MCNLTIIIFDDVEKSYLYDKFFVSNFIFFTKHLKIDEVPGFLFKIPGFFSLNCQVPSFSRFPGKVGTLN